MKQIENKNIHYKRTVLPLSLEDLEKKSLICGLGIDIIILDSNVSTDQLFQSKLWNSGLRNSFRHNGGAIVQNMGLRTKSVNTWFERDIDDELIIDNERLRITPQIYLRTSKPKSVLDISGARTKIINDHVGLLKAIKPGNRLERIINKILEFLEV